MEFIFKLGLFLFALGLCNAGPLLKQNEREKRSSETVEFQLLDRDPLEKENIQAANEFSKMLYSRDSMFYYHHDCEKPISDPEAPDYKRSLCPWEYHTKDTDVNRYPSIIPQAKLKCNNVTKACLGVDPAAPYECAPVTTTINVWHNNPDVSGDVYVQKVESVTVGYTCAAKKIKNTQTQIGTTKKPTDDDDIFKK